MRVYGVRLPEGPLRQSSSLLCRAQTLQAADPLVQLLEESNIAVDVDRKFKVDGGDPQSLKASTHSVIQMFIRVQQSGHMTTYGRRVGSPKNRYVQSDVKTETWYKRQRSKPINLR